MRKEIGERHQMRSMRDRDSKEESHLMCLIARSITSTSESEEKTLNALKGDELIGVTALSLPLR
jgi:hypothetical protein